MNTQHAAPATPAAEFVRDTQALRLVLDTGGTLKAASSALCQLLERSADELFGQYIWHFTALDSLDATLTALNQAVLQPGASTIEQCWLTRSNEEIWLQWSYLPVSADGTLLAQARVISGAGSQPQQHSVAA